MGWLLLAVVVVFLWGLPFFLLGRFIEWVLDQCSKRKQASPQPVMREMPNEMPEEGGIGERKRRIITLPDFSGRHRALK